MRTFPDIPLGCAAACGLLALAGCTYSPSVYSLSVTLLEDGRPVELDTVAAPPGYAPPEYPYTVRGYTFIERFSPRGSEVNYPAITRLGAGPGEYPGEYLGPSAVTDRQHLVWWLKIEGYKMLTFGPETEDLTGELEPVDQPELCAERVAMPSAPTAFTTCPITMQFEGDLPDEASFIAFSTFGWGDGALRPPMRPRDGPLDAMITASSSDGVTFAADLLVHAPRYIPYVHCVVCGDTVTVRFERHGIGRCSVAGLGGGASSAEATPLLAALVFAVRLRRRRAGRDSKPL